MNRRTLFFLLLICSIMIHHTALAEEKPLSSPLQEQTPAQPITRPGPPVASAIGPAGGTVPKGAFGVVLNYALAEKDRSFHHSSREYRRADGKKVYTTQNILTAKLRFGLGGGWDIRTATPIAYNRLHNNPAGLSKKNGIGDTLLILHKQLMSQAQGKPLDLAFGIGVWCPTGWTGREGIGSGTWGGWGELGASYAFGNDRHLLEAELGYLWRGHGGHAENYGKQSDLLRINARYAFAINKHFDTGVETQYEHAFQGDARGVKLRNAYATLFAGPTLTVKIPSWKATLGLSAQFSLYQCYQKAHSPHSLGERARFELKLSKNF